jgi:hypothetical protein
MRAELGADDPPHPLTRGQRDRPLLERRRVVLPEHHNDFPAVSGGVGTAVGLLPIHPTFRALRVITDPDVHHRPQRHRGLFLLFVAHLRPHLPTRVRGRCVYRTSASRDRHLGHIRGWEDDAAAEPAPTPPHRDGSVLADGGAGPVVARDGDGPVVADGGDGPDIAVAHPVPPGQGASFRLLSRVMIVSPTPAAVPSRSSTSRSGFSVLLRIRSARARRFRVVTSSWVSAISTETSPASRSARQAL